jgi:hypothetical protein
LVARRRKCQYLKNPDETYIRLDPVESNNNSNSLSEAYLQDIGDYIQPQQSSSTHSDNKIFPLDKPDTLFASSKMENGASSSSLNGSAATRPDKMIEQLTDGLVQLTLHQDTSKLTEHVTPWRSYGEFVRWTPEPHLPSYYTAPIDMPSRPTQEHLISVFFNECHYILPALSRSMFYDQLKVKGPLVTPLLLNIMYAHAAKRVNNPAFRSEPDNPATQGDLFYNRAKRLVDDFLDVPRISTVIAFLYMSLYDCDHIPSNGQRSSRAWMYSGMAIRMCFELGLHTANYSSQMSQCDIELRKRVLWTCFVMDKLESCTMERPWMLRSTDVSLDLPTPLPEDTPQERLVLEAFNQLCKLMILMEKVIHFFTYTIKTITVWTMNEENQILQYLEAINQWREMLPNELQWSPVTQHQHHQQHQQHQQQHQHHQQQQHHHHQNINDLSRVGNSNSNGISSNGISNHHLPSSAVVANLHLVCYDLELSLIMCCRYQDEQIHRERRRALANTITYIVSLTVQNTHLMYTFAVSTFSGVFAALTHAVDFENPHLEVSEGAKIQFRKSLEDVRLIVEKIPMRDLRNFARLVDLTLQPKTTNNGMMVSPAYATAFSAISDMCHKKDEPHMSPTLFHQQENNRSGYGSVSPERHPSPFHNPIVSSQFGFDPTCLPNPSSSPSGSVSAAAVAAAAAAVGAVGAPVATSGPSNKNIEPADYTFELISVADEWARSLIY